MKCLVCGLLSSVGDDEVDKSVWVEAEAYCDACRRRYPASLLKAHQDPFDYALGHRVFGVVRFSECVITGDWVHLNVRDAAVHFDDERWRLPLPFERGIDVRVDDILWCADAPNGS